VDGIAVVEVESVCMLSIAFALSVDATRSRRRDELQ